MSKAHVEAKKVFMKCVALYLHESRKKKIDFCISDILTLSQKYFFSLLILHSCSMYNNNCIKFSQVILHFGRYTNLKASMKHI